MKQHVQIKNSYNTWKIGAMMHHIFDAATFLPDIDWMAKNTLLIAIEWWIHNIGYYLTLPFIKNSKIKALNERFKHVDLMIKE